MAVLVLGTSRWWQTSPSAHGTYQSRLNCTIILQVVILFSLGVWYILWGTIGAVTATVVEQL